MDRPHEHIQATFWKECLSGARVFVNVPGGEREWPSSGFEDLHVERFGVLPWEHPVHNAEPLEAHRRVPTERRRAVGPQSDGAQNCDGTAFSRPFLNNSEKRLPNSLTPVRLCNPELRDEWDGRPHQVKPEKTDGHAL